MAEMWNGVADGWERNADFVDEHLAAATRVLLDAADVGEGDEVLELACGPGGVGIAAAGRVGPTGRVTLADVAEAMVAIAETRAARRGPVGTLVCDQGAIPAPDASYDAVLSRHGLMFADDPAAAVGEAVRVLRPEGRFAAMVWDRREARDAIRDRALSAGAAVAHPAPDGLVFAGSVLIASGRAA